MDIFKLSVAEIAMSFVVMVLIIIAILNEIERAKQS